MSITMHICCNTCQKDFKTTFTKAPPLSDLPDMCPSCWDKEVTEEIKEREVSMKFREATKNDNWHWEGDSLSYFSDSIEEDDDIPMLPLLTSGTPVITSPKPSVEAVEVLPESLKVRVDSLIAALISNRAY